MKLATAFVASILSLTALGAQAAAPADDTYSVTVKFADLDLNREAGIDTLYRRIKGAARRVCDQQAADQPGLKETYPVCVKRAMSSAIARIDRPMLTEYVAKLGGTPASVSTGTVAAR